MAPLAPFFWSIHFSLPDNKNIKINKGNFKQKSKIDILYLLKYSATKEEVALENIKPELELQELDELIFTEYLDKRPGSHGLFSQDGSVDLEEIKDEIKNQKGILWYGIISLREDEAVRINHIARQDWENSLRKSFPDIAEQLNISESNFRWVAAYHEAKGHPHCHYIFWEKETERNKGILSPAENKGIKKVLIRNIYDNERERLFIEKNYYRDAVRNGARDILGLKKQLDKEQKAIRAKIGERPGISPKISSMEIRELEQRINGLSNILPGHGRVALKLMPEEVKEQVREISDWLLEQPAFKQEVEKYLAAHIKITQIYTFQEQHINKAKDNAYSSLRDRIAQDILKSAVEIQKEKREKRFDQFNIYNSIWKGVWVSIQREKSKAEYEARVLEAKQEQEKEERKRREGRSR